MPGVYINGFTLKYSLGSLPEVSECSQVCFFRKTLSQKLCSTGSKSGIQSSPVNGFSLNLMGSNYDFRHESLKRVSFIGFILPDPEKVVKMALYLS